MESIYVHYNIKLLTHDKMYFAARVVTMVFRSTSTTQLIRFIPAEVFMGVTCNTHFLHMHQLMMHGAPLREFSVQFSRN